jgi:hypothetical protein
MEALEGMRTLWSPRQESNLYLTLRRHPFYPLNYEELSGDCSGWAGRVWPRRLWHTQLAQRVAPRAVLGPNLACF